MKLDTTENSWLMFLSLVKKAKDTHASWESPKRENPYWIKHFDLKTVVIQRNNANDERLTKKTYLTFLKKMDKERQVSRNQCGNLRVATLTTIVYFHPLLNWANNHDEIVVNTDIALVTLEYQDYGPIPNDDINELQVFARKVRKGQTKFRNALLRNYDNRCCISDCEINEVLDACHIEPHTVGGINQIENGLLLRTDLHSLFDCNLISISPVDYIVHIHPSLRNSEYAAYQGKSVSASVLPDKRYLQSKWAQKTW